MSVGLRSSILFINNINILLLLFSSVKDVFCIFLFITFFELKPLSLAKNPMQLKSPWIKPAKLRDSEQELLS